MLNHAKIKALMSDKLIKDYELAAKIGVSTSMMSYILNGLRTPNVQTLVRIANELDCTVDELIIKA
jgi:transcriptional regulator with XRE-family HTH domain